MAANIPQPVDVPQGRPRGLEQLILTLASAAPSALMQFLDLHARQQQDAQQQAAQQAAGQGAASALAGAAAGGTFDGIPGAMQAFQAAGGTYSPAQAGAPPIGTPQIPVSPAAQQAGLTQSRPVNSPAQAARPASASGAGINPLAAPSLLQSIMQMAQGTSAIQANNAQTTATTDANARANELQAPTLEEALGRARLTQHQALVEEKYGMQKAQSEIGANDAQAAAARAQAGASQASVLEAARTAVDREYEVGSQSYGDLVKIYASMGTPIEIAKSRAALETFHELQAPTGDEYRARHLPGATVAYVAGKPYIPDDPTGDGQRLALKGKALGLQPEDMQHFTEELTKSGRGAQSQDQAISHIMQQVEANIRSNPSNASAKKSEVDQQVGIDQAAAAVWISDYLGRKIQMPPSAQATGVKAWLQDAFKSYDDSIGVKVPYATHSASGRLPAG